MDRLIKVYIPNKSDIYNSYILSSNEYEKLIQSFEKEDLVFDIKYMHDRKVETFVIFTKHFVRDNPHLFSLSA